MKLIIYQVDAFANKVFEGNPAAVIPMQEWMDDELMQQIAMENNLAETAFFVPKGDDFTIRWFTPEMEINLCGHATLASAYIIFNRMGFTKSTITFHSKSGPLYVSKQGELLLLDFPSWMPERISAYPNELLISIGNPEIAGVYKKRDYIVELMHEDELVKLRPDFAIMKKVDGMIIVTAPGNEVDFVSRFFAPAAGIDEDPVTGSAHSQLIPFWNYKLGKKIMQAKQLSKRGGNIYCEQKEGRVIIGGQCVFYMKGEIEV